MKQKVVVTGFGVISPFGYGDEVLKDNLYAGRNAFKAVTAFDTSNTFSKFGAQTPIEDRRFHAMSRWCVSTALQRAKLDRERDRDRLQNAFVAVGSIGDGTHRGPYYAQFFPQVKETNVELWESRWGQNDESIFDSLPTRQADELGAWIGSQKPALAVTNACVASSNAIGCGFDAIQKGRSSLAVVGGVNALTATIYYYFDASRALAEKIVRPFSKNRTGLLIGDGAAYFVLESEKSALERGAEPLAEILGWGLSSDGFHVSQPEPTGRGLAFAMKKALEKSQISASEIDYVNAHGTGTPLNDRAETLAMKSVFGEKTTVPISSTKSMTGHMLEATGAVESVISVMALLEQKIPPTANFEEKEDGLDLDYVTEGARSAKLNVVMSNSCAFGGNNCSIVFRRWGSK